MGVAKKEGASQSESERRKELNFKPQTLSRTYFVPKKGDKNQLNLFYFTVLR
jgi:hypothetical protein